MEKASDGGPHENPMNSVSAWCSASCRDVRVTFLPEGVLSLVPAEERKNCEKLKGRDWDWDEDDEMEDGRRYHPNEKVLADIVRAHWCWHLWKIGLCPLYPDPVSWEYVWS